MIPPQIRLTEEQYRRIKTLAEADYVSTAHVVHDAIATWLAHCAASSPAARWERALSVMARFDSGLSDAAENHDAYLAEAYGSPDA